MKFIDTEIMCYTKEYNTLLENLHELETKKYKTRDMYDNLNLPNMQSLTDVDLELDIINLNKKIDEAREFRRGKIKKREIITFYESDKLDELFVELPTSTVVVKETIESFSKKLEKQNG